MDIRPLAQSELDVWIDLRHKLWPDHDRDGLHDDIGTWADGALGVFVAQSGNGLVGFVEVAIRDRAPGCTSSPVGYLEAWWVDDDHRRTGIGTALLAAAETWAREHGAVELASDAHSDNAVSRKAHAANGFSERRAVVRFHKQIADEPQSAPAVPDDVEIELREINDENVHAVLGLDVGPHQQAFVAPNSVSLSQYGVTTNAWTRAVYAGDTPVGFILLSDDDEKPRYYLWRFMIDHRHQRRGFGRSAMELIHDYVRTRPGGDRIYLTYVPADGGPERFYKSLGYRDTGVEHGGELEAVLELG